LPNVIEESLLETAEVKVVVADDHSETKVGIDPTLFASNQDVEQTDTEGPPISVRWSMLLIAHPRSKS
jgi:hypothetical protein